MTTDHSREKELSLLDHLEELRQRLIKSVIAVVLGMIVGYFIAPWGLDLLVRPMVRAQGATVMARSITTLALDVRADGSVVLREGEDFSRLGKASNIKFYREGEAVPLAEFGQGVPAPLLYLRPMDPFLVRLKAALVFGLFLAMPFLLYQVWAFIEPGLVDRERRVALPLLLAGVVLFPLGAGFAYFMMELALRFFTSFVVSEAVMFNDAQAYLSFVLTMMLAFGIVFELPLALVLAMHVGITTPEWLAARRKYIFVFLLVAAALITPTGDPITLLALALPLHVLFEISLVVGRMLRSREVEEFSDLEPDEGEGDP